MKLSASIPANSNFKFPLGIIMALLVVISILFVWRNYTAVEESAKHAPAMKATVDDIINLGNEIYNSGKIIDRINDLPLEPAVLEKLKEELLKILSRTYPCNMAEVYF